MHTQTKCEDRIDSILDHLERRDKRYVDDTRDLLLWGFYARDVFSQFGLRYDGAVFRQSTGTVVMTIKAVESGVPLVAFVTSATTVGCVSKALDLLWDSRLKWQKDKYPWI